MIGSYTKTSLITIYSTSYDKDGVKSDIQYNDVKCKIFDENKLRTDNQGNEVMGSMTIFLDKNQPIDYPDFIKIEKKDGIDYTQSDKEWKIIEINKIGGFKPRAIEVVI